MTFEGITSKDLKFSLVRIDEHEYTVPSEVAKTLEGYRDLLNKERKDHAEELERLEGLNDEKYDEIAWGIMMNLEQAVNRDSLLAKSINAYEVDPLTSTEVFTFRNEVLRRIKAGLAGLTPDGTPRNK